jgi:hypothetical protein
MKKQYRFAFASIILFTFFFCACVEGDYSIDDINKNGAFSHEEGLFFPLGNLDTIRFNPLDVNTPIEVTYIKTVEGLFSEELYKNFVIPNKGVDEPLGQIAFFGDFLSNIANPIAKEFSDFELSVKILKRDGEDSGISIANQTFQVVTMEKQAFNIAITKEDVLKLKEAYALRIIFTYFSKKVEKTDCVLIHNLYLKLSGGIRITME